MTVPRLLDANQVAALLGITRNRVYELGKRGELPVVRISRKQVRYREDLLLAWMEARGNGGPAEVTHGVDNGDHPPRR